MQLFAMPISLLAKRLALRLTQADIAKRAGVSQGYISLLETGEAGVGPTNIEKFAKAYEISVQEMAEYVAHHHERRRADRPRKSANRSPKKK